MKNLSPVFWNEGLFLRPHHFQQQDRFHGDRLAAHLDLVDRFHWGVAALEIERSALKNRVLEVSRCVLVFPGGEIAMAPENAQVDPRSFAEHLPPAGRPLDVYLGLPRLRPNEPNYTSPDQPGREGVRYRLRNREVRDEVSGDRPASMDFAVASVRVLFGDEDRGAFDCVKVAEVVQRGAEIFEVSDAFLPASLRIDAVPEMARLCNSVRDGVSAKAHQLHGMKPERLELDPALLMKLVTVNSYAAVVTHLTASGNVHPFRFYEVMASLAGALSSFSSSAEAWDIPPYLHENPGPAFRETARKIDAYLDFIVPVRYTEIRLSWVPGSSCYEAAVGNEHFNDMYRYCLVFAGDRPPEAVKAQVKDVMKVGSPDRIPQFRNLNLRGLMTRALDTSPAEIPRRAAAYFQLETVGPEWERVREARRVGVYLPGVTDLTVSLFVIRP
jgi:type VI secretion system protein ImpJ